MLTPELGQASTLAKEVSALKKQLDQAFDALAESQAQAATLQKQWEESLDALAACQAQQQVAASLHV